MEPGVRPDGLQLEEPRAFQTRFWAAQRWLWAVFALVILAAVSGLTGAGGPLSRQTIESAEGTVDAPRVSRRAAADSLFLTLPGVGPFRTATVSEAFVRAFEVASIEPQPVRAEAVAGGARWTFAADGAGDAEIAVHLRPHEIGRVRFGIALGDGPVRDVSLLVLP
jgi:hypothetical protein